MTDGQCGGLIQGGPEGDQSNRLALVSIVSFHS